MKKKVKVMQYNRKYLEDNHLLFCYKSSDKNEAIAYGIKMLEGGHDKVVVMKFLNLWEVYRDKY